MDWNFGAVIPHLPQLLFGTLLTLELTFLILALGTVSGFAAALGRMSRYRAFDIASRAYIDFFRTTPPMIQIVWCYYVLPVVGLSLSAFWAVVLALGLNSGAFLAEIFRAGIQAVPVGQRDAAQVLGLSGSQTFLRIIAPQAFRTALAPLAVQVMLILKGTSLASVLVLLELTQRGQLVSLATLRPIETFTIVAIIYFGLTYPLSRLAVRLEGRHAAAGRSALQAL